MYVCINTVDMSTQINSENLSNFSGELGDHTYVLSMGSLGLVTSD